MRDEMQQFEQAGVQPFGVNPAGTDAHRHYAESMRFNFPLLSDPDRSIARAYQTLKDDGKGIMRTVYLIGRDGTVRFAQRGAPAVDEIVAGMEAEGRGG